MIKNSVFIVLKIQNETDGTVEWVQFKKDCRTLYNIQEKHGTERESAELQTYLQWSPFNILCEQLLEFDEKEDFVDRAM